MISINLTLLELMWRTAGMNSSSVKLYVTPHIYIFIFLYAAVYSLIGIYDIYYAQIHKLGHA